MSKEQERKQGFIALLVICAVAAWIAWAHEIAGGGGVTPEGVGGVATPVDTAEQAERAAREASMGEIPKPEGHGR